MATTTPNMAVSAMTAAEQAEIEASLFSPKRLYEPFVGKAGVHGAQRELAGFISLLNRSDRPIRVIYAEWHDTWSYDPTNRVIYWTDTMLGHKVARWKAAYTGAHEYGHDAYTTSYDVPREVFAANDRVGFHRMMNAAEDPRMERCLTADVPAFSIVAGISHRWSFDQQLESIRRGGIDQMPFANQVMFGLMAHAWEADDVFDVMSPEAQAVIADSISDFDEAVAADSTGDMVPAVYRIWLRVRNVTHPPQEDEQEPGEGDPTEGDGDGEPQEGEGEPGEGDGEGGDGDPTEGDGESDAEGDGTSDGNGKAPVSDGTDGAEADEGESSGSGDAEGDDTSDDDAEGEPSGNGAGGGSTDGDITEGEQQHNTEERPTPSGATAEPPRDDDAMDQRTPYDKQREAEYEAYSKQADDIRKRDVGRPNIDNGSDPGEYHAVSNGVRNNSLRLMRGLRRVLADNAVGTFRRNERSGRVVPGAAHRLRTGRTDIFRQREEQSGTTDWSVVMLVDHSSSTNSFGLCYSLRECAVTVIDAVTRVNGVDLAVAGYGEGLHYAIPFGSSRINAGSRVAHNLSHPVGTDEATGLEWAIAQSLRRGADGQIILVLTDGEPNEPGLARMLAEQARSYGILTAGIGVNHPAPAYHPVSRSATTTDLPVVVPEVIKSMMRGRS